VPLAHDGQPEAVEGRDLDPRPGAVRQERGEPLAQLARRPAGEGDGQALLGPDAALGDEVGDPGGEGAGLARPRPGDDEHRATGHRRGGALLRVERPQRRPGRQRVQPGVRDHDGCGGRGGGTGGRGG
jgi:hypothetical protein